MRWFRFRRTRREPRSQASAASTTPTAWTSATPLDGLRASTDSRASKRGGDDPSAASMREAGRSSVAFPRLEVGWQGVSSTRPGTAHLVVVRLDRAAQRAKRAETAELPESQKEESAYRGGQLGPFAYWRSYPRRTPDATANAKLKAKEEEEQGASPGTTDTTDTTDTIRPTGGSGSDEADDGEEAGEVLLLCLGPWTGYKAGEAHDALAAVVEECSDQAGTPLLLDWFAPEPHPSWIVCSVPPPPPRTASPTASTMRTATAGSRRINSVHLVILAVVATLVLMLALTWSTARASALSSADRVDGVQGGTMEALASAGTDELFEWLCATEIRRASPSRHYCRLLHLRLHQPRPAALA